MFAGLGRIIVLAVMVGRFVSICIDIAAIRSDPQLRALDALKPSLSYDGWQKDVLEAEWFLLFHPSLFDGHLASMRKKQSLHGDRSYPSLFDGLYDGLFDFSSAAERAAAERASQLRALVALKPSLSYDGWQKDLREADMYRLSYPRRFDGHLASMREKQSLHDGPKALMVVVVVVMVVMVMVFGRRAFDGCWWWLGLLVLWWVSARWELVVKAVERVVVFVWWCWEWVVFVCCCWECWRWWRWVVEMVFWVVEMVAKKAAAFFWVGVVVAKKAADEKATAEKARLTWRRRFVAQCRRTASPFGLWCSSPMHRCETRSRRCSRHSTPTGSARARTFRKSMAHMTR